MNYECHITLRRADGSKAEEIAKLLHWKYSQIDGDPVLGKEVFAYLTTHSNDMLTIHKRMTTAVDHLRSVGIEVVREKIELIVYDTKAKVRQLDREAAIEVARKVAAQSPDHEYLQHVADDPTWLPHEWVIRAIIEGSKKS